MAFVKEKQGDLGQLSSKSKVELQELQDRQENLLKNRKFVQRLPDKGAKIKEMLSRINELLTQFEEVDKTADLFENMVITAEEMGKQRSLNRAKVECSDGDLPKKSKFIPSRNVKTRDIHELAEELQMARLISPPMEAEPDEGMSEGGEAEKNKPQETNPQEAESQETKPQGAKPQEAAPLEAKSGEAKTEAPHPAFRDKERTPAQGNRVVSSEELLPKEVIERQLQEPRKLKYRYDECLETSSYGSKLRHEAARLLSVEESVALIKAQQTRTEEVQVRMAAERLAQRLGSRMTTWHPEGGASGVRYRDHDTGLSDEEGGSDPDEEEDEEVDYPD